MAAFKAIIAKQPNKRAFMNAIKSNVGRVGEKPKQDFDKTVSSWTNKPVFKIEVKEQGGSVAFFDRNITLFVGVESNWTPGKKAGPNDIYRFVTRGTSKRHALMSNDFSPKTRPNIIGSSAGRGGVIAVGKNIVKPGIEARNFEPVIAKRHTRYIVRSFQEIIDKAARVSQWAISV